MSTSRYCSTVMLITTQVWQIILLICASSLLILSLVYFKLCTIVIIVYNTWTACRESTCRLSHDFNDQRVKQIDTCFIWCGCVYDLSLFSCVALCDVNSPAHTHARAPAAGCARYCIQIFHKLFCSLHFYKLIITFFYLFSVAFTNMDYVIKLFITKWFTKCEFFK